MPRYKQVNICLLVVCVISFWVVGCSSDSSVSETSGSDIETAGADTDDSGRSQSGPGIDPGEAEPTSTADASTQAQPVDQDGIAAANFSPDVNDFSVNVIYETGAEPYTGSLNLSISDTWEVTRRSFIDLFQHHAGRSINVPSELEQMIEIEDNGVTNWTVTQLVELGNAVAPALIDKQQVRPVIIFVNGMLEARDRVLGVHISNTHFAFVFKDIVRGLGGNDTSQRYIEQATVIHEIGHAIGLVNNGVPLSSDHEDTVRPHHTINSDGVMYWAVESGTGTLEFVTDLILGNRTSLFGPESLLDAQSYMPQ